MAVNRIDINSQVVTLPGAIPHMPAIARILSRYDRNKLAAFVSVAIDLLDVLDGDPEAEGSNWPEDVRAVSNQHLSDDCEATGDEADAAWVEWDRLHGRQKRGPNIAAGQEDAEDDDGPEDDDPGGTDLDFGELDEVWRAPVPQYGVDQRILVTNRGLGFGIDIDTLNRTTT